MSDRIEDKSINQNDFAESRYIYDVKLIDESVEVSGARTELERQQAIFAMNKWIQDSRDEKKYAVIVSNKVISRHNAEFALAKNKAFMIADYYMVDDDAYLNIDESELMGKSKLISPVSFNGCYYILVGANDFAGTLCWERLTKENGNVTFMHQKLYCEQRLGWCYSEELLLANEDRGRKIDDEKIASLM